MNGTQDDTDNKDVTKRMESESIEPPAEVSAEERPAQVPESTSMALDNNHKDYEKPRYPR